MVETAWVVAIEHRHGSDVSLFRSCPAANGALFDYVQQWWGDVAGLRYEDDGQMLTVPDKPPTNPTDAVAMYFAAHPSEWFSLDEKPVLA